MSVVNIKQHPQSLKWKEYTGKWQDHPDPDLHSISGSITNKDCDSCCPFTVIPEGYFIPFVIISESDESAGAKIMYSDGTLNFNISISFDSYWDEDNSYFVNYYDGSPIAGLTCGSYYLMVCLGGIWYSTELFQILPLEKFVGTVPEMIYDAFHLPLRVFTSLIKQYSNRCDDECYVTPITDRNEIIPFLFEPGSDIEIQIDDITTTLVKCDGTELDISSEVDYIIANSDPVSTNYVLKSSISRMMRNINYSFYSTPNYVFQQIMVSDTGYLNKIEFEYNFNGEAVHLEISVILGRNPMSPVIHSYEINEIHDGISTVTIDYSTADIYLHASDFIILKVKRLDGCIGGMPVWWTRIYPYGEFGEVSFYDEYKEELTFTLASVYDLTFPDHAYAVFTPVKSPCYATYVPAEDADQRNYYTATESHNIKIELTAIYVWATGAGTFEIFVRVNGITIYNDAFNFNNNSSSPDIILDSGTDPELELGIGDVVDIMVLVTGTACGVNCYMEINTENDTDLLYGVNYQDRTMTFNVWMNKEIHTGSGTNYLYQTGKIVSQPLECGVYYVKIGMPGHMAYHTWYTDNFLVANINELESIESIENALGMEGAVLTYEEDIDHLVEYEEGGNVELID